MKKGFLSIVFSLIFFALSCETFAMDIQCSVAKKIYTPDVIRAKITECLDKRDKKTESSITDFYCPSGDSTLADGRPLTDHTIPYHVAVALYFAQIDEDVMDYICKLRELRVESAESWTEDLRNKFDLEGNDTKGNFANRYKQVCDFDYIQKKINTPEKTWIDNAETYPQSICIGVARKKSEAWYKVGTILMGDGIAKAKQNSKDTFIDKVKTKYSAIIDKYILYSLIAGRAISNLTALPKKTIQR